MFTINLLFIYSARAPLRSCSLARSRLFEISTENQTTRIIMYWSQIIIFAIEISLSAICKITSLCSSRKYITSNDGSMKVGNVARWSFLLTRPAWKQNNLTFRVSLFFRSLCLHTFNNSEQNSKAWKMDLSILTNLSINNLEYNFYSSDLSREIAPKKYSESQTYLVRFNLSKWKILIYFRFR